MRIDKIKPIPKYMEKKILKVAKEINQIETVSRTEFYSYLTTNDGELVNVMVAVKRYRGKWYMKQVAVHGLNSDYAFAKDIDFFYMGGYVVDWSAEGCGPTKWWNQSHNWWKCDDKFFNNQRYVVNREYVYKFEEFKYCAIEKFHCPEIFKYLRIYLKYPQAEYLLKMNLGHFATKVTLLKKLDKDKEFRRWFSKNSKSIWQGHYSTDTLFYAFENDVPLIQASKYVYFRKSLQKEKEYKYLKELFNGKFERLFIYFNEQKTGISSYMDYLIACKELDIDLYQKKNLFPNNFKYWHDIRIDQYNSQKAKIEEEKHKEFCKQFLNIANKYLPLEKQEKTPYMMIIAKSPDELVQEGNALDHCVGRMNYDQKFVREESLIFFVRNVDKPTEPFVTVEYSPSSKRVLQCYGYHDRTPQDDVTKYVYKKWLPYANKQISKMQIAS